MLNIQQIETLRRTNPQLYETLERLAGASLDPNQGWSLDDQITDGTNVARLASSGLTPNQIDPTKSGVLRKGSVPPRWSGAFTYLSTTSSLTWSWSGLDLSRRWHQDRDPEWLGRRHGGSPPRRTIFILIGTMSLARPRATLARKATRKPRKRIPPRSRRSKDASRSRKARSSLPPQVAAQAVALNRMAPPGGILSLELTSDS